MYVLSIILMILQYWPALYRLEDVTKAGPEERFSLLYTKVYKKCKQQNFYNQIKMLKNILKV